VIKTIIMKIKLRTVVTLFLAGVIGVVSFYITRSLEADKVYSTQVSMRNWLAFTNEQDKAIRQSDPDFDKEAAELSLVFIVERQQLAHLLDASGSSDEQITVQVEKVVEANHALLKRVVTHILVIRKHLSPQQQQQLMRLCSNIISGRAAKGRLLEGNNVGPGKQYFGTGKGRGRGRGRLGQERGKGRGQGQGWGRRHRRGLTSDIDFTPEQIKTIQQLDPGFKVESTELTEAVFKEHKQLALLLDNLTTNDNEIWQQLETLLEVRAQRERRISQHVLLIRPLLSTEQQKVLVGLCAQCGQGPEN